MVITIPIVSKASLRNFQAPDIYLDALTRRLPKNAIILPLGDNAYGALTYWSYFTNPDPNRYVIPRTAAFVENIGKSIANHKYWTTEDKYTYLTVENMNPNKQPFRVKPVSKQQVSISDIFVDYAPRFAGQAKYLLPDGMMFRIADHPTSDKEVLQAEAEWRKQSPDLLRLPTGNPHRLERDAWAILHRERGAFFTARMLWNEAVDSYKRSLEWVPDDGLVWYNLAFALDQAGRYDDAMIAYKQAMELVPQMPGIRSNLALLYIQAKQLKEAELLLEEELKLDPENGDARHNLDLLRKKIGQ